MNVEGRLLTVSSDVSPSFLPMSWFCQWLVLSLSFDMRPGTTRGIVCWRCGVVTETEGMINCTWAIALALRYKRVMQFGLTIVARRLKKTYGSDKGELDL